MYFCCMVFLCFRDFPVNKHVLWMDNNVMDFFAENVYDWIQAKVYGEPYPELAGRLIQLRIKNKGRIWERVSAAFSLLQEEYG